MNSLEDAYINIAREEEKLLEQQRGSTGMDYQSPMTNAENNQSVQRETPENSNK